MGLGGRVLSVGFLDDVGGRCVDTADVAGVIVGVVILQPGLSQLVQTDADFFLLGEILRV